MSQSAAKEQPLKLRGRLVASHQIPVITTNRDEFERKLAATIAKAPALFENAPCVLDLSACELPLDQNSLQQLVDGLEAVLLTFELAPDLFQRRCLLLGYRCCRCCCCSCRLSMPACRQGSGYGSGRAFRNPGTPYASTVRL